MFDASIYVQRRKKLKTILKSGLVLLPGNKELQINYFTLYRQDVNFLYYFGHNVPDLWAMIDIDNDKDILFGDDRSIDDVVWMGPDRTMKEKADEVGALVMPSSKISEVIAEAKSKGQTIHFLPQYDARNKILFEQMLGISSVEVNNKASLDLTKAIISQRTIKSKEEIEEINNAINISYVMNTFAMKNTKPGLYEKDIYGALEGIALSQGRGLSFPMIFSIRGETLHNNSHENLMKDGDLVVLDSGVESANYYASDITRTFPVNGKFSPIQKDIYNVVLNSQLASIEMMKPGVPFRDCHLIAANVIASGLKDLGFMKGNVDDAVAAGAHALFFPHGLGHMMGLDVHDMEPLGENYIGYNEEFKRSTQFGLAYLRMAKRLEPGFVMTVEPGIYFIPQLIANWKAENNHSEFINYDMVEKHVGFGGVRIEDDVLVTDNGNLVLGSPIPKTVEEVEETCNS